MMRAHIQPAPAAAFLHGRAGVFWKNLRPVRQKSFALLVLVAAILPWALLVVIPASALALWAAGIGH